MLSRNFILAACLCLVAARPLTAFAPQSAPTTALSRPDTSLGMIFGAKKTGGGAAQTSAAADEAVDFFVGKYGSKRKNKPIDESKLRGNFAELVRLFGEQDATKMVRATPQVLEFRRSYFAPIVEIFDDKFGVEATRGLLLRNPALLGIKPDGWGEEGYGGAATAGPETIALSYVVAATRPLGNFGIVGLLGVMSIPAIDAATGLGIRDAFLHTLGVK